MNAALAPTALLADTPQRTAGRPFAAYVHIPFCARRCGYCDFNTYVNNFGPGADRETFINSLRREILLAKCAVAGRDMGPLDTIFFGGGTPTELPARHLAAITQALSDTFGLAPGVEITSEANPDSISEADAQLLAEAGFTRISLGMQSADQQVLQLLDRTHNPANVRRAVAAVKAAGMEVSIDLIYATPGESDQSWQASVRAALELAPDHVSAYALGIEPGTKLGGRLARGEIAPVDDDLAAERYEIADTLLGEAGYHWYEVSNWARTKPDGTLAACRHNQHYWRGDNWWGFGPGAHGHIDGVRWMNMKHPRAYAASLAQQLLPVAEREVLSAEAQLEEMVMLGIRLREGIAIPPTATQQVVWQLVDDGLLQREAATAGRCQLTLRGRLLADSVTYQLLGI